MVDNTSGQPDRSIQVKLVLLGTSSENPLNCPCSNAPHKRTRLANLPSRRGRRWQIFRRLAFCACVLLVLEFSPSSPHPPHHVLQVSNEFQPNREPTIGAAFLTQKCRLEDRVLRYEIWDTAGQERFHSLAVRPHSNPRISSPCEARLTHSVPIASGG